MVARQSGPIKMNHAWIANCTRTLHVKNDVSCEDYSSRILLSYGSLWGFWWKLRLREDKGENPVGLKVCLRSTDEAKKSKSWCSSKAKRRVKSPPDSATVDSDGWMKILRGAPKSCRLPKGGSEKIWWAWRGIRKFCISQNQNMTSSHRSDGFQLNNFE